jgi:hypothetical protein
MKALRAKPKASSKNSCRFSTGRNFIANVSQRLLARSLRLVRGLLRSLLRSLLADALHVLPRVEIGFDWFCMVFSFSGSLAFGVTDRNRFLSFSACDTPCPLAKWPPGQRSDELRLVLIAPFELLNNRLFTRNAS